VRAPSKDSNRIAVAVNCLDTEAMSNRVAVVSGVFLLQVGQAAGTGPHDLTVDGHRGRAPGLIRGHHRGQQLIAPRRSILHTA